MRLQRTCGRRGGVLSLPAWRRCRIRRHLKQGGLIAYPTEGVFGLGCDPFNREAVERLFRLKGRPPSKRFLLIAACRDQLRPLLPELPPEIWERLKEPRPITWIVPASRRAPRWLLGKGGTLAVRITAHPLAAELCRLFGRPLISTSANPSGRPPAQSAWELKRYFGRERELLLVLGEVGGLGGPTPIFDARSGRRLR